MSEVASLVPFGEFHSALFYRDLFLHNETQYERFWCPFCGIKLFAVLIYEPTDAELAKSPHFKKPKSVEHLHGCDGNPGGAGKPRSTTEPARKIEKQPFILPTRLIEYVEPPPRVGPAGGAPVPPAVEVTRRREEAGQHHARARFSVALVQSVAEAHLGMVNHAYKQQRAKKWTDKQRKDWLTEVFSAEIELRGATMRYREAFHDLHHPVRRTPRVYYSEGYVTQTEAGYAISAAKQGKENDADEVGRPFIVVVRVDDDGAVLRGAKRELMAQLQRAATQQHLVRWYGYGLPVSTPERFELCFDIDNLSDLFVRRKPVAFGKPLEQRQANMASTPAIGTSAKEPAVPVPASATAMSAEHNVEQRPQIQLPSEKPTQAITRPVPWQRHHSDPQYSTRHRQCPQRQARQRHPTRILAWMCGVN